MGAEFFSLTMILAMHTTRLAPGERTAFVRLVFDIAHENNA